MTLAKKSNRRDLFSTAVGVKIPDFLKLGSSTGCADVEATARRRKLADKRRKLLVAVAFGLPLFLLAMARDFGRIAPWLTPFWAANEAVMEAAGGHTKGVSMPMHYPARADLLN